MVSVQTPFFPKKSIFEIYCIQKVTKKKYFNSDEECEGTISSKLFRFNFETNSREFIIGWEEEIIRDNPRGDDPEYERPNRRHDLWYYSGWDEDESEERRRRRHDQEQAIYNCIKGRVLKFRIRAYPRILTIFETVPGALLFQSGLFSGQFHQQKVVLS